VIVEVEIAREVGLVEGWRLGVGDHALERTRVCQLTKIELGPCLGDGDFGIAWMILEARKVDASSIITSK